MRQKAKTRIKLALLMAVALLVVGVTIYYIVRPAGDDGGDSAPSGQNSQNRGDANTGGNPVFDPIPTTGQAFEIRFTSKNDATGQINVTGMFLYDGEGNSHSRVTGGGETIESVYTPDAVYSNTEGVWQRYPFGPEEIEARPYHYSESDIQNLRDRTGYRGVKDCPAGECYVWRGDDITIYVDTETNRISKTESRLIGVSGSSETTTMIYTFKQVTVTPPDNYREVELSTAQ